MGCDIHAHIEVKLQDNKWYHYTIPNNDRDYTFFARLANVRNTEKIQYLSTDRGFPNDISEITKLDLDDWNGDAHSLTFIDREELKILSEEFEDRFTHDETKLLYRLEDYPYILDIRYLAFFDN